MKSQARRCDFTRKMTGSVQISEEQAGSGRGLAGAKNETKTPETDKEAKEPNVAGKKG